MDSGIYQIENEVNGNRYIGSAVDTRGRWARHLSALRHNTHHNPHLQAAFRKYGEAAFGFSVLEQIEETLQLIPREQHYLDTLKPEYNIAPIAGSSRGLRHTKEARARMSKAQTGSHHSAETRAKISNAQMGERNHNYGKRASRELRAKLSEARTGKPHPNRPHPQSAKTRAKMSKAHKARWRRVHGLIGAAV